MTNSKCILMYALVHNLSCVLFNTNVHTYTASPVLYYYLKVFINLQNAALCSLYLVAGETVDCLEDVIVQQIFGLPS